MTAFQEWQILDTTLLLLYVLHKDLCVFLSFQFAPDISLSFYLPLYLCPCLDICTNVIQCNPYTMPIHKWPTPICIVNPVHIYHVGTIKMGFVHFSPRKLRPYTFVHMYIYINLYTRLNFVLCTTFKWKYDGKTFTKSKSIKSCGNPWKGAVYLDNRCKSIDDDGLFSFSFHLIASHSLYVLEKNFSFHFKALCQRQTSTTTTTLMNSWARNKRVTLVTILCLRFNEPFDFFVVVVHFLSHTYASSPIYILSIFARLCHNFALIITQQTSISIVYYCGILQRK